jgi:hypothetical protein
MDAAASESFSVETTAGDVRCILRLAVDGYNIYLFFDTPLRESNPVTYNLFKDS